MSSNYWNWIAWSVSTSCGIFLGTGAVLFLLKWECDTIFYDIVKKLLHIERCFIDAHHRIVRKDDNVRSFDDTVLKYLRSVPSKNVASTEDSANASHTSPIWTVVSVLADDQPPQTARSNGNRTSEDGLEDNNGYENKTLAKNKEETSIKSKSHPEHLREVLNVYGRYMSLNKRGTFYFTLILTTLIISGALIAAFNSIILATATVYKNGPCPPLGPMECFCGNNYSNFSCDTGEFSACPLDVNSGVCFRWVARDLTTSGLTTELGVTTGLLLAFGQIAQALIRIYLFAFNKRLNIATGIHRIVGKTIGINKVTARTRCCCCNLCCHCSPCNLSLFKHPAAVIGFTGIYIAIPLLMIPAVILLYYYQLTVTALTFVVLIVLAVLCILSIVWIMVEESEASSNIPGGWTDIKQLIETTVGKSMDVATGKISMENSNGNPEE